MVLRGDKDADGRRQTLDPHRVSSDRHVDYGYVQTAHKAQGATADRVVAHLDRTRLNLVNRQSFYVAISRARTEAVVVTDDDAALRSALAACSGESATALEAQRSDVDVQRLQADVRDTLGHAYAAERSREPQVQEHTPEPDRSKPDRTPARDRDMGL